MQPTSTAAQGDTGAAPTSLVAVAEPRDVRDLSAHLRDAATRGTPQRLVGAGTWLAAGRPVRDDAHALRLGGLRGITEYVPGDLTLTARAGTPLAEIASATAAERQWLALDPAGAAEATLGATIATASAGPLAHAFGTPRDNVLGLEAVTGIGDVVRAGGRVVKNVAGFDLVRLFTGAWGTLGALTEVTVRLRALPAADETVAMEMPQDAGLVRQLVAGIGRAPLTPWALEAISAPLAGRLGLGDRPMLVARFGGSESLVRAQHDRLSSIGATTLLPVDSWARLRAEEPANAAVIRFSRRPAGFADTWMHALAVAERTAGWVQASAGRGVARVVVPLPAALDDAEVRELGAALGQPFEGTRIGERLPPALWPLLSPSRATDRLARGVRRAFDPHLLLNPGILGESP